MYPISTLPTLIDPETNEYIRATHFTRERDGEFVEIEQREKGEGFWAVLFENGAIWDGYLNETTGSGWR